MFKFEDLSSKVAEKSPSRAKAKGKRIEDEDSDTAQKMKFSIKDFFSKCDQIRRKLRIWSHLLKKSQMENFIFCAVWLWLKRLNSRTWERWRNRAKINKDLADIANNAWQNTNGFEKFKIKINTNEKPRTVLTY